jgi:hypothetical protein
VPEAIEQLELDIQPESDIYGTYRRLDYSPWTAIAELVDNATGNYFSHRKKLEKESSGAPHLEVDVWYDRNEHTLTVTDNAHGMDEEEFMRAIQLAKPPKVVGRSEFGMGLKTSSCWMGPRWSVTSKQLGSPLEFSAHIDIAVLRKEKPRSILFDKRGGLQLGTHYTTVKIEGLNEYGRNFAGRTLGKIKRELGSMYRRDIASGDIQITFNGDPVSWSSPKFKEEDGVSWVKEISVEGGGKSVTGWISLFEVGKASEAGFHLFRQGRLIHGGKDKGWKPHEIFKAPNSFMSQRLYGELDFDEWDISHTKNKIDFSGDETTLIEALLEVSADYIQKAKEEKGTRAKSRLTSDAIAHVIEEAASAVKDNVSLTAVMTLTEEGHFLDPALDSADVVGLFEHLPGNPIVFEYENRSLPALEWRLDTDNVQSTELASHGFPQEDLIQLLLNVKHPFIERFVGADEESMSVLVHFLYIEAVVERLLRKHEGISADTRRSMRDNLLGQLEINGE